MDNATNNDTFIANLEELLRRRDIVYDSSQHRIICFPHVVHICVTHVIKQFTKTPQEESEDFSDADDELEGLGDAMLAAESLENDDFDGGESEEALTNIPEGPPGDESRQTYEQALHRKPLDLVRRIIRAIRASNQRWEFLKQVISDGNKNGRFKDSSGKTTMVPLHQLLLDVKTRWDSTYLMIKRILVARSVRKISFFTLITLSHAQTGN
jgi:hypothetical protein